MTLAGKMQIKTNTDKTESIRQLLLCGLYFLQRRERSRQRGGEGQEGRTQSLRGSRGYPGTPQDLVRSQGDLLGHLALEGQ